MRLLERLFRLLFVVLPIALLIGAAPIAASQTLLGGARHHKHKKHKPPPDSIVFKNGDRLSGTLVREIGGVVTFHSEELGDLNIPWSKIKELRTTSKLAVLNKSFSIRQKNAPAHIPMGTLSMSNDLITVQPGGQAMIAPIPVKSAGYIVDEITLNKELLGGPGFFAGWDGAMTAGATVVEATQKQYTFSGSVALSRVVPTVSWLDPENRTTINFTGSYGRITQRAYVSEGVFYPATNSKSAIYHADAERDQYFSKHFYALAQTSFDHNYGQGLDLQQVYGAGIGYTALKQKKQELDFKVAAQYEKQDFINASEGVNQNLVGSTFAVSYGLHLFRGLIFNQQVAYLPAYNNLKAYSATESNTLGIPFYKALSFSLGTQDSYLNNPAPATPPPMRNSFQFIFGATYSFKSRY